MSKEQTRAAATAAAPSGSKAGRAKVAIVSSAHLAAGRIVPSSFYP
jgi:hypothetical protein